MLSGAWHVTDLRSNDAGVQLVQMLKPYEAFDANGPLKLKRYGRANDGGYVVADKAMRKADALLGFGIADDSSFEEEFATRFYKPAYGFDCGVHKPASKNRLYTFINECVGSDQNIYQMQNSNGKVSSLEEHIKALNLQQKRLFIKMDIEGAEFAALQDIGKLQHNITGIALELHAFSKGERKKAVQLLAELRKYFVLVNVHGNNWCLDFMRTDNVVGKVPLALELSFINKNLLTDYRLAPDHSHPSPLDMPNNKHAPELEFQLL